MSLHGMIAGPFVGTVRFASDLPNYINVRWRKWPVVYPTPGQCATAQPSAANSGVALGRTGGDRNWGIFALIVAAVGILASTVWVVAAGPIMLLPSREPGRLNYFSLVKIKPAGVRVGACWQAPP